MKRYLIVAALLSGCTGSYGGTGQTTSGLPVAGQYTALGVQNGQAVFDISVASASAGACVGQSKRPTNSVISPIRLTCEGGVNGSGTFASDFSKGQDTIIYRLSNGERGDVVIGGVSPQQQATNRQAAYNASYNVGVALAGGVRNSADDRVTCRTYGSTTRCQAY